MEDFFKDLVNNVALFSLEDANGNVEDYELIDFIEYQNNEYVVIAPLKDNEQEESQIDIVKMVKYGEEYQTQNISDTEFENVFAILQERHRNIL